MEWAASLSKPKSNMAPSNTQEGIINIQSIKNTLEEHAVNVGDLKSMLIAVLVLLMILLILEVNKIWKENKVKREQKMLTKVKSLIDISK